MPSAPECGTRVGLAALEHPEAAQMNAKTISARMMDNRRDISELPIENESGPIVWANSHSDSGLVRTFVLTDYQPILRTSASAPILDKDLVSDVQASCGAGG